jgi:glycine/D-amino acid oxidase-like deaminating enzyme
MPILGVDPTVPALCYACGYSRNGILLAPWAADQLAGLLTSGSPVPALAPFGVERFSRPVP